MVNVFAIMYLLVRLKRIRTGHTSPAEHTSISQVNEERNKTTETLNNFCKNFTSKNIKMPIPVAGRSKACRLMVLGVRIPPTTWISVSCESSVLSGRSPCEGPIPHPEESYLLWCVIVCDLETSRMRWLWPAFERCASEI